MLNNKRKIVKVVVKRMAKKKTRKVNIMANNGNVKANVRFEGNVRVRVRA